jgi:hypothetical protein
MQRKIRYFLYLYFFRLISFNFPDSHIYLPCTIFRTWTHTCVPLLPDCLNLQIISRNVMTCTRRRNCTTPRYITAHKMGKLEMKETL